MVKTTGRDSDGLLLVANAGIVLTASNATWYCDGGISQ